MLLRSLAAIGLVGSDGQPSAEWVVRVASEPGETFPTPHGTYKRVSLDGGSHVWIDIGADGGPRAGQVIGMTPIHDGVGAVEVEVSRALAADGGDPLCGGWAVELPAMARGDRPLPVTLEIVPFRLQATAATSFKTHLRVLGLAFEATVYPSPATFLERVPGSRLVAVGAVSPLPAEPMSQPSGREQSCMALVTGRIEQARQIINPLSQQPYFWLQVATDRGPFNIVANGRTLLGAAPVQGAVVQAKARLVATPVEPPAQIAPSPPATAPAAARSSQGASRGTARKASAAARVSGGGAKDPTRQQAVDGGAAPAAAPSAEAAIRAQPAAGRATRRRGP